MKISILSFILCFSFTSISQAISYNDVVVIVNDNSQTSIDIANYFQAARNIPNLNMIHVSAPTTEEIDSAQFELIRAQIESYLLNNNLVDSINYIVTTKGVPLKINGSCFDNLPGLGISCASFDSELCLILGTNASYIGQSGSFVQPVFSSTQHFSRATSGVYLVTRLTGYTKQDVYHMIDRSGFQTGINKLSAQAIFDLNNATGGDSSYFHDICITPGNDVLAANAWNSQIDANFDPLLNQTNVFGYAFYGHSPIINVTLNYTWTDASIGAMVSSNTVETFDPALNTSGKFLLADLIAGGCTGGFGYVNSTYFSTLLRSDILFSRYLDEVEEYNLAESFYMAEQRMSWQAVVVGDPKSSVRLDNTAGFDDNEELNLRLYPNPTTGKLSIASGESISSIKIYGINGALVLSLDSIGKNQVELDLNDLNGGVYLAHIISEGKMTVERIVLTK